MFFKKSLVALAVLFCCMATSFSQTYTMPTTGTSTYTTCAGTVYDPGGAGSYANGCSGTTTFYPSVPGNYIQLVFNSFAVETCCDGLYIYDGTSTAAPLIGQYTTSPGTVYATNASGALTLYFYSDGSVTYNGFDATLSCLTTLPPPGADLVINSQTASPTSVGAGNSVSVSCYIYNQGTTSASSSNVGYYLSTDAAWDAGDTYLNYSSGSSLPSSSSSYRSTTVTIPGATTPGSYYILYYADYSNAVAENVETNNVSSVAITVLASTVDLVIQSQSASPTSLTAGSSLTASCYIYNQGTSIASSSNVGYYLSADAVWDAGDTYLNYSSGTSLGASASAYKSATLTIPGATTPGSYYILYYADYSNAVSESIETNNVATVAINVLTPVIDLIIQTQSASPTTVASGNTLAASCYIYNQGNTTASSSNVGYYLSVDAIWDAGDTYLNYSAGAALGANSSSYRSATLTIPGATTPGAYYILYYADYSNVIVENVESNNVVAAAINVVTPITDLVIQSQTATPVNVAAGSTVAASCYVYNQGNVVVSSSSVGYYLSTDANWDAGDTYLNYSSGSSLNPATSSYRSATLTIPGGTSPGSYYLLYFADYTNAVVEDVETNNVNYVAITVASPVTDLIVQSQTANPLTIAAGATTAASCYIYNQGNTSASSSTVGYYLSADAIWDAGDTYLNYSSGGALAAATSSLRSATLTIPLATTPGSYYILYFADYANAVTENVETNNVVFVPITVVLATVDLIIQSQSASPTAVIAGNSVSATCYIYNQGNSSASSSNVGYYLSTDVTWDAGDTYLNYSTGGTLAATSSSYRSATVTIPGVTPAGTYYILYYADYSNAVSESVETNNVSSVLITVSLPNVDLIIQSQSASPTSVIAGNSVSVSCYIYNQGNTLSSSSNVGYYLSTDATWDAGDTYLNYSTGGSLNPSTSSYRSATVTIPGATTPGTYYILYYADYSNAVSEVVETNNVVSVVITVALANIDLIIQSQSASPTSVVAGNSVSVSCYIYNQGNSLSSSSNVGYYLSTDAIWDAGDTYLNYSAGSSLAASTSSYRSTTVTIPGATTPGTYYILYYADYSNAVSESVETNNVVSVVITVALANIDLIIQSQTASPTSVIAGNSVSVSCYIYNQGNSLSSSSNVGYYLSANAIWDAGDTYLNYSAGSSLAASTSSYRSTTVTIPGATPAGTYYILYYADYSNAVSESVETNNVVAVMITVSAAAIDLIIQSPTATPTNVVAGNAVSATCYIYNQGNSTSSSSNVGYYLSADAAWDAGDVYITYSSGASLAASSSSYKSTSLTIPGATAPGNYYILYYADYSTLESESVETNNVSAVAITVGAAYIDLIIQTPAASPSTVSAGGNVSASCYIYNQGNSPSSSSNVGYYLSTDAVWDAADTYLNNSTGASLSASASASKSASLNIPAATPTGSYYIIYFADYSALVSENVETNNYASLPITVTPFAFVVVMPQSGSNQYSLCTGTIYDDGGTSTYSNSVNSTTTLFPAAAGNMLQLVFNSFVVETCCDYLQIYDGTNISAPLIGTFTSNPGTITATNASGALTLHFYSDGSVVMAGFDASISCLSSGALPDLSSLYPTCSPMTIPQASSANITCQVLNSGNSSAGASVIGYYLSADTIWDIADTYLNSDNVSTLAAAASAVINSGITIPLSTPTGSYYLLFVSDTAAAVAENIETNNVAWLQINVSLVIGINQLDNNQYIAVFPNPSHGPVNFVFSSPSENSAFIRIFDYVGKLTDEFTAELSPNSETTVLHEMNGKGIYFVEITIGENIFYTKIIVQ
ncbi:MAG: T9SS type A sorting domain-containing protein [Bacteroidetes bacterium]|nr:T9SS type A sorting domain-containing protein [Bacteroidota bacterium]